MLVCRVWLYDDDDEACLGDRGLYTPPCIPRGLLIPTMAGIHVILVCADSHGSVRNSADWIVFTRILRNSAVRCRREIKLHLGFSESRCFGLFQWFVGKCKSSKGNTKNKNDCRSDNSLMWDRRQIDLYLNLYVDVRYKWKKLCSSALVPQVKNTINKNK